MTIRHLFILFLLPMVCIACKNSFFDLPDYPVEDYHKSLTKLIILDIDQIGGCSYNHAAVVSETQFAAWGGCTFDSDISFDVIDINNPDSSTRHSLPQWLGITIFGDDTKQLLLKDESHTARISKLNDHFYVSWSKRHNSDWNQLKKGLIFNQNIYIIGKYQDPYGDKYSIGKFSIENGESLELLETSEYPDFKPLDLAQFNEEKLAILGSEGDELAIIIYNIITKEIEHLTLDGISYWSKRRGNNPELFKTENGEYIIAYSFSQPSVFSVHRYTKDFTEIWNHTSSFLTIRDFEIQELKNGDLLASVNTDIPDEDYEPVICLERISKDGDRLWKGQYKSKIGCKFMDILESPSQDLILVGYDAHTEDAWGGKYYLSFIEILNSNGFPQ